MRAADDSAETFDPDDALLAQRHAVRNRDEIERSAKCGCFHCGNIFRPGAIVAWRQDGPGPRPDTARCPLCGHDAVLGDASRLPITPAFLKQIRMKWFRR